MFLTLPAIISNILNRAVTFAEMFGNRIFDYCLNEDK